VSKRRASLLALAHGGVRSHKVGFDSRAGDPLYITSSECDGFAYDPAKVVDQVQFLARTFPSLLTLEPDGQATGCNPVLVGSTPTGVSDFARIDRYDCIRSPTTQADRIPPSPARRSAVGWKTEERP
jgi:hypothetical protein